jgi:hypothetical protein
MCKGGGGGKGLCHTDRYGTYMFLLAKLILLYVSLSIESRSTCFILTCRAFSDRSLGHEQFVQCYDKKYAAKIPHNRCVSLVK